MPALHNHLEITIILVLIMALFLHVPMLLVVEIFVDIICCSSYTLYEITAFNLRERAILQSMYTNEHKICFMNGISNEAAIPIDVAVETQYDQAFEAKLQAFDIQYVYSTERYMDLTVDEQGSLYEDDISKAHFNWDYILKWVDKVVKDNKNIQKIVLAKTYEQRDIFLLKISMEVKNPIVFIVGGEDGKDWTSSAVILNLVDILMKQDNKDQSILKYFNLYLVPVLNPDGFVYSHNYDRLWSKNRRKCFSPKPCTNGITTVGVNIARNWFYERGQRCNLLNLKNKVIDSCLSTTLNLFSVLYIVMNEECKGVYIGHEPLSEKETKTLSYVLNTLSLNMIAFINLKGFGKFITIPYAHNEVSYNHDIIMDILTSATTIVKNNYNITYYVDTTNRLIYNFSGNMADWVKKKLNIPIVFTQYLEHRNDFLPKPEHIVALMEHFYIIMNETLLIAKDIYSPLFYNRCKLNSNYFINTILLVRILVSLVSEIYHNSSL